MNEYNEVQLLKMGGTWLQCGVLFPGLVEHSVNQAWHCVGEDVCHVCVDTVYSSTKAPWVYRKSDLVRDNCAQGLQISKRQNHPQVQLYFPLHFLHSKTGVSV